MNCPDGGPCWGLPLSLPSRDWVCPAGQGKRGVHRCAGACLLLLLVLEGGLARGPSPSGPSPPQAGAHRAEGRGRVWSGGASENRSP